MFQAGSFEISEDLELNLKLYLSSLRRMQILRECSVSPLHIRSRDSEIPGGSKYTFYVC